MRGKRGNPSRSTQLPRRLAAELGLPAPAAGKAQQRPLKRKQGRSFEASKRRRQNPTRRIEERQAPQEEDPEALEIAWLEDALGLRQGQGRAKLRDEFAADGLDDLLDDLETLEGRLHGPDEDRSTADDDEDSDSPASDADGPPEESDDHSTPSLHPASIAASYPRSGESAAPKATLSTSDRFSFDPQVRRRISGLVNRLSPASLPRILDDLAGVQYECPADVFFGGLARALLNQVEQSGNVPDSLLAVFAGFGAAIARRLSAEDADTWSYRLLAATADDFEQCLASKSSETRDTGSSAQVSTLVRFFGHLFIFEAVGCDLLVDVLNRLTTSPVPGEDKLAALLAVLRLTASQIDVEQRQAIKAVIHSVSGSADVTRPRPRFLHEALQTVLQKPPPLDQAYVSALTSLRGIIRSSSLSPAAKVPSFAKLVDLDASRDRQRPAVSTGQPSLLRQNSRRHPERTGSQVDDNNNLLHLARKQGMNTPLRQKIFTVLLGSEDYVESCDRLRSLHLDTTHERELFRVILQCIRKERSYNPYYTLVVQGLARGSRSAQITLRYCLWDLLRENGVQLLGGLEKEGTGQSISSKGFEGDHLESLAKAYGWWMGKGCLSITVLKPIPWQSLPISVTPFIARLLTSAMVSTQDIAPSLAATSLECHIDVGRLKHLLLQVQPLPSLQSGMARFLATLPRHQLDGLPRVHQQALRSALDLL